MDEDRDEWWRWLLKGVAVGGVLLLLGVLLALCAMARTPPIYDW